MKRTRFAVVALLGTLIGCARHTIPNVVLTPQTRIGPADDFGPGIVEATSRDVDFQLDLPAYVIALRVTRERGVELIAPHTGNPRSQRGTHYVRAEPLTSWREGTYSPSLAALPLSPPCTQPADQRATPFSEGCVDWPNYVPQVSENITQLRYNSPPEVGYWLLIVSDTPTRARDFWKRVKQLDLANTSLVDRVHRIPEALLETRTTRWAAYYTPFGVPSVAGTQ